MISEQQQIAAASSLFFSVITTLFWFCSGPRTCLKLDPLVLLWLGQNRAEKAVDDLFDGVTLGSKSIRATKSSNHSTSSTHSSSSGSDPSTNETNSSGPLSRDLSSTTGFKKSRAIFGDDFFGAVEGVRFESSSSTPGSLCPTPVKIKKEEDGVPSPRSHLSNSVTVPLPGLSSSSVGSNGLSPGQQAIARKRSAYQASLTGGGSAAPSSSVNGSSSNVGLLSESSPEVSSSQNCTGISPVPSLESSEIDLELWDLDIHESSTSQSSGTGHALPSLRTVSPARALVV